MGVSYCNVKPGDSKSVHSPKLGQRNEPKEKDKEKKKRAGKDKERSKEGGRYGRYHKASNPISTFTWRASIRLYQDRALAFFLPFVAFPRDAGAGAGLVAAAMAAAVARATRVERLGCSWFCTGSRWASP
jgi:hypothetical protein